MTTDPFAPFLATIAERHYEMMAAPCQRCDGTRRVRYTDAAGDTDTEPCPDCDKHRKPDHGPAMVFADWLEEHGDCEWAEFVRIGVELEQPVRNRRGADNRVILTDRRSDLLARHGAEWARRVLGRVWPDFHAVMMKDGHGWLMFSGTMPGSHLPQAIGTFQWGVALPETFRFPTLAGFMGHRCPSHWGHDGSSECPACAGTGRLYAVGPALARRVPLRRVEFADKRPWDGTGDVPPYWFWHDESDPRIDHTRETHSDLPRELYELLEGREAVEANAKYFPTEAAANDALSDAAIRRAVQQGEVAPKTGAG